MRESLISRWPAWLAGLILGFVNVIYYMLADKPFTIYTGFYHWGANILSVIGFKGVTPPLHPLYDITSVGDLGLILGAAISAVISGEFAIRKGATKIDYVESAVGGVLMALGVTLAYGCNWGGFFSAITALSLHGFTMLIGLIVGGYLGLRYTLWRSEKLFSNVTINIKALGGVDNVSKHSGRYSFTALTVAIALLLALSTFYYVSDSKKYVPLLLFGVLVGIVIQRSGFCFATAFRDLFYGPEFRRSISIHKGIALGLLAGVTGIAIAKFEGFISPLSYVSPVNVFNVVGGILFAFGSVLLGGCGSGSLWRLGEGHLRVIPGLLTTIVTYPIFATYLRQPGVRISPPLILGWDVGIVVIYVLVLSYLGFIMYLERRKHK